MVLGAFVGLIAIGTALLWLPLATDGPGHLALTDALFMSTSATTVTGLTTVDISELSLFGELVLLALIQVGGFGIMTIGAIAVLLTMRRVGLRQRMLARAEIGAVSMGELKSLILAIGKFTIAIEGAVAVLLLIRFAQRDDDVGNPVYSAVFHSISAFNNAGISLYSDSLQRFVGDPLVGLAVTVSFIIGGLGFPVLVELRHRRRPRRWSLHTRLTLVATAALLVIGPLVLLAFEWTNPGTLGPLTTGEKLLAGWFQGSTPRTAGFETVPIGAMNEPTLLFVSTLMFIGAGPASTSGGIKVTTFAVLAFVLWSEVRGDADVNVFRRRIPPDVVRRSITVALLAVGLVVGTSLVLVSISDVTLTPALFEAASAFGTVGLSTGITADLPTSGQLLLVLVMLAGRVGVITFVTALALRQRSRAYRYPEEQPIIG
jgi:trk system potassium uptake protein